MRHLDLFTTTTTALLLLAQALPAQALEAGSELSTAADLTVHWSLETSLATTYVARGVPQYSARDIPSSQTSLSFAIDDVLPGTLSLGVWNATALRGLDEQPGTGVQVDFTASYATPVWESLSLSVGFLSTLCPVQPVATSPIDPNHEAILALAWAGEWLTPSVVLNVSFR